MPAIVNLTFKFCKRPETSRNTISPNSSSLTLIFKNFPHGESTGNSTGIRYLNSTGGVDFNPPAEAAISRLSVREILGSTSPGISNIFCEIRD